jgi:hypothetical protein
VAPRALSSARQAPWRATTISLSRRTRPAGREARSELDEEAEAVAEAVAVAVEAVAQPLCVGAASRPARCAGSRGASERSRRRVRERCAHVGCARRPHGGV